MIFDHSLYVRGYCLVPGVAVAGSFVSRGKGLLFTKALCRGQALLIPGCSSVHTFFMRYAIDLIFLDAQNCALEIRHNLASWRCAINWNARAVLELPAGSEAGQRIQPGDELHFIRDYLP